MAFSLSRMDEGSLPLRQWSDLDLHGHFIEVRRSRSGGQVTTPKNGESRRVDMSDQLAEKFQRLRVARKVETLKGRLGSGSREGIRDRGRPPLRRRQSS
jgi:hypothetical protein